MSRSRQEVKSRMAKVYFLFAVVALSCLAAQAEKCRLYGCKKYAHANGYCELHQSEGKKARAKAAAEAREFRRSLNELEACRQADAEAAAEIAEATAARERKRQTQVQKKSAAERAKFEQPLEGLFGKRFGEKQPAGTKEFVPDVPYRKFEKFSSYAEGTNGVVGIAAFVDFGSDGETARRELNLVLDDLAQKHGRKPYKIFTKSCDEVWALGFGGVKGVAHQQIQVSFEPRGGGYRLKLSAFVIRNPQKTLKRFDDIPDGVLGDKKIDH